MTAGPNAGETLQPRPGSRGPQSRSLRNITGLVLLLLAVLAAGVFGIRAVWPSSSPARPVTETNDNGYFVVIDQEGNEVGSGSATRMSTDADDIRVEVSASLAPGGVLRADVTVANASPNVLEFHGGVRAEVTITRDEIPWRTAEITDPSVTTLSPSETFEGHATIEGAEGPAQFVFSVALDTWRR
jgi:hypothetical protein